MTQNTTYSAGVAEKPTEEYEDIRDIPIETETNKIQPHTFNGTQNTMYGAGLTNAEEPIEDVEHEYEDLETVAATMASPPS